MNGPQKRHPFGCLFCVVNGQKVHFSRVNVQKVHLQISSPNRYLSFQVQIIFAGYMSMIDHFYKTVFKI